MAFTMTNGTGANAVTYTADEWMALVPAERLRLISTGHFTYARTVFDRNTIPSGVRM